MLLRRLLSLDYVLEHTKLSWLPTEPEKVSCFKRLGFPRKRLPLRVYRGAVGTTRRYFALKLPIAVEADRAVFVDVDPGHSTGKALRSWGVAHRGLWEALRNGRVASVPKIPAGRQSEGSMKWRHVILILAGPAATISRSEYDPFPRAGDNPVLDLIAFPNPALHAAIEAWYYLAPGVAVLLGGVICLSVWRVWFQPNRGRTDRGTLPAWPVSSGDPAPSIMVGEVHPPVEARETFHPCWLVIPERGLYTGVLIFGCLGEPGDRSQG